MRNENRQRTAQREKIDRRNTVSEERCGKRKRENGKQRPQEEKYTEKVNRRDTEHEREWE